MKKLTLLFAFLLLFITLHAQDKKAGQLKEPRKNDLPGVTKCIQAAQENLVLYTQNLAGHSQEHDVNSIINDIERYLDSMPKTKSYSDQLLIKYFAPLRHFFLLTANKTTLATSFLYADAAYRFCMYNDTALTLYIGAIKDGDIYNLSKMTEKRATTVAFENCLLPSLKALDEFKGEEIKYIAVNIYYGCKDTREGAPNLPAEPYCLTLIARLGDIQQYAAGLITAKGLLANGEVYLGDTDDVHEVRRIQISVE